MSWRVVQAFDLAAALSDVAKGLKKKLQDLEREWERSQWEGMSV